MTPSTEQHPELDRMHAAVEHVRELLASDSIPINAAEGLLLGLVNVIGTLTGDPQLPAHIRGSYDGLLELSRELLWKIRSRGE